MDLTPLWISLKTVVTSTAITFVFGVLAARWRLNFKGRSMDILDGLLMLPLAMPPTVIGLFLLLIFGRNSPVGEALSAIGINIVFSWPAAVMAATIVSFPLMYQTLRAAFMQIDPSLLDAARIFGLSEWRILWQIMIPLCWASVAAGIILSFVRALGEFGATLMIAGNIPGQTQTMSLAVFFAVESGQTGQALILSAIILSVSVCVVVLLGYLSRQKQA